MEPWIPHSLIWWRRGTTVAYWLENKSDHISPLEPWFRILGVIRPIPICLRRLEFIASANLRFQAPSQNFQKRLLSSSPLSVCLSIRMHATTRLPLDGFLWNLIRVFFETLSRKSHKKVYFTYTTIYTFEHVSFSSSQNKIYFRQKCRENQNTHFIWRVVDRPS